CSARSSCHRRLLAYLLLFFFSIPPPPISTLFPYTTLFRSSWSVQSFTLLAESNWVFDFDHPLKLVCAFPRAGKMKSESCAGFGRSEEHTSELQSLAYLVCRLLLEKKKITIMSLHSVGMHLA